MRQSECELASGCTANQFVELVAYRFLACLNGLLIKGELGIRGPSLMLRKKNIGVGAQRTDFDCFLGKHKAPFLGGSLAGLVKNLFCLIEGSIVVFLEQGICNLLEDGSQSRELNEIMALS